MKSLSTCLKRIGLAEHEAAILRGMAKDNRDDGHAAHEAAVLAVTEYLEQLINERAELVEQVRAQVRKHRAAEDAPGAQLLQVLGDRSSMRPSPDAATNVPAAGETHKGSTRAAQPHKEKPPKLSLAQSNERQPSLTIADFTNRASEVKSVIVTGDLETHKARIKQAIQGKPPLWNARARGWIFPKDRENEVRYALRDLLAERTESGTPAASEVGTAVDKPEAAPAPVDTNVNLPSPQPESQEIPSETLSAEEESPAQTQAEGQVTPAGEATPIENADSLDTSGKRVEKTAKPRQVAGSDDALTDKGVKIGGARKDWRARGLTVQDLEGMTAGEEAQHVTKGNIWKPDYPAMLEAGADVPAAATLKVIYDRLAATPAKDTPAGRRQYVQMLGLVRDAYQAVKTVADVKAAQEALFKGLGWYEGGSRNEDLRALLFSVYKGRKNPFQVGYKEQRSVAKLLDKGWPNARQTKPKAKAGDGETPARPELDKLKRVGPQRRAGNVDAQNFMDTFGLRGVEFGLWAATDERQKHVNEAYDALLDLAETLAIPPKAISLNGTLGVAFGARGQRFAAHYEPGKLVINIAKLTGPGALAHEFGHAVDHYFGELGRADAYQGGARGASGWYTQPRAGDVKRLSHLRAEMAQAFDGLMRAIYQRDKTQAEVVREAELALEKHQADVERVRQAGLRFVEQGDKVNAKHQRAWLEKHGLPHLKALENKLVRARGLDPSQDGLGKTQSSYFQQAKKLSGMSGSKGYWARPTELFARAFEAYVFDRLAKQNRQTDYLVHGVEEGRFASPLHKGDPYPAGLERQAINQAFDALFETVLSRETAQGVALFSLTPGDVVQVDANALGAYRTLNELRLKARQYGKRYIADRKVMNAHTGMEIIIPWQGIKHDTSGPVSREAMLSVPKIPEMLEKARLVGTEADRQRRATIRAVHRFEVPIEVEGRALSAHLIVREQQDGKRFYDHWIRKNPDGNSGERATEIARDSHQPASGPSAASKQGDLGKAASDPARHSMHKINDAAAKFQAGTEANRGSGMRLPRLKLALNKAIKALSPYIDVRLLQSESDLPPAVQQTITAKAQGRVRGLYNDGDGTVYLVADRLATPAEARRVLIHEVVGHLGLERMLGRERFSRLAQTVQAAKAAGNTKIAAAAQRVYETHGDLDAGTEAKEILAYLAENGIQHSLLRRVVAQLKLWLAKLGIGDLTTAQIEQTIARAARFVEGRRTLSQPRDASERFVSQASFATTGRFGQAPGLFDKSAVTITELGQSAFRNLRDAQDYTLKTLPRTPVTNIDTGWSITLGHRNLSKLFSASATRKSILPEHLEVARGLRDLLKRAVLAETHADKKASEISGQTNIAAVHRFYAPVRLDGEVYRVKLTVLEHLHPKGKNFKSYELAEIETPARELEVGSMASASPASGRVDSAVFLPATDASEDNRVTVQPAGPAPSIPKAPADRDKASVLRGGRGARPQGISARTATGPPAPTITIANLMAGAKRDFDGQPFAPEASFSLAPAVPAGASAPNANQPADTALAEAMRKAGMGPKEGLAARTFNYLQTARASMSSEAAIAGIFDQYHSVDRAEQLLHGLLPAEQRAYVAMRQSTGTDVMMRALLEHGAPEWRDGGMQLIAGSKGLLSLFTPVKADLNAFLGWKIARRAQRLLNEGKENHFTQTDIDQLRTAGENAASFKAFAQVEADYIKFKTAVLDFAEKAGLINPDTRVLWDQADHIPFFRVTAAGDTKGPRGKRGFSHQVSGIKQLKGGTADLGDPMENILLNFSTLISSSMKNHALRLALVNFKDSNIVTRLPPQFGRALIPMSQVQNLMDEYGIGKALPKDALQSMQSMLAYKVPTDPDVVRVMDRGKPYYFRVHEPLVLNALTSVNEAPLNSMPIQVGRAFKRTLTGMITASPEFIYRSFVRDAVHSWVINEDQFKLGISSLIGAVKSLRESPESIELMAFGSTFQGGYVNANDPQAAAKSMRIAMRAQGIDVKGASKLIDALIANPWDQYRKFSEGLENANRVAVYQAALKAGKSKLQAAFEAKDLMDYSMQGGWRSVQVLNAIIPFLNARVQGNYKLYRAGAIPLTSTMRAKAFRRGMGVALFSLALYALNYEDERYEALEEWDRDTYWHIFLGEGTEGHIKIPKPFEVGVIYGTVVERFARRLLAQDDNEKSFERLLWNLKQIFGLDVPQVVSPLLDIYSNKSYFTKRPIENMGDEKRLPSARYNERTSDTMRAVGSLISDPTGLSPKELEHLWDGYLGTMGAYVLQAVDVGVRYASGAPSKPTKRLDSYVLINAVYEQDPAFWTRHQTELYDLTTEVEQIYATVNKYQQEGQFEAARELYNDNADKLAARGVLSNAREKQSAIQAQIDQIYRSETLSPDAKQEQRDRLLERRNELARQAVEAVESRF